MVVRFGHLLVLLAGLSLAGSGQAACATNPDSNGFLAIPSSWTTIPDDAFNGCQTLVHVVIPGTVNIIGERAFLGCPSLATVVINTRANSARWDGVIIDASAFQDNSALVNLDLGTTVSTIGRAAFEGCSTLTTVTIPDSVTMIANYAFRFCRALRSATIPATSYERADSSYHPFYGNGCGSTASFSPGGMLVDCQLGGSWLPSISPTTGAPTTRSPTLGPTPAPTTGSTIPTSSRAADLHADCASNFSCFTDINAPDGVGAFARHLSEADPTQNEPHVEVFSPLD